MPAERRRRSVILYLRVRYLLEEPACGHLSNSGCGAHASTIVISIKATG